MNAWFAHPGIAAIASALAWTLAHFLWQGTLLAGVFASTPHIVRRTTPQARYLVGCAVLAVMLTAPTVTFIVLLERETPPTLASMYHVDARQSDSPLAESANSTQLIIASAWAFGTLMSAAWLFGGWLQTRALRRLRMRPMPERIRHTIDQLAAAMHVRATIRLVDSLAVTVPLTIGWIAPVILLPASMLTGLSSAQLRAIIAHEFAHVRRCDYLVNLLQRAIESLLFFHPAVWWVSACVRQEREYCCDDIAAAVTGDNAVYAQALAELESLRSRTALLALSSQGGSLMNRIARILDVPAPAQSRTGGRSIALAAGFLALVGAAASIALACPPDAQSAAASEGEIFEAVAVVDDGSGTLHVVPWIPAEAAALAAEIELEGIVAEGEFTLAIGVIFRGMEFHPAHDPIGELMEADELAYPWDIFEAFFGIDELETEAEELDQTGWMLTPEEGPLLLSDALAVRRLTHVEVARQPMTFELELVPQVIESQLILRTELVLTEFVGEVEEEHQNPERE